MRPAPTSQRETLVRSGRRFERRLCRRKLLGLLASDGGAPAPRRPAARTAPWGEASEGGRRSAPTSFLHAAETLHIDHVLDLADRLHDVLELAEVVNLDDEVVQPPAILGDRHLGLGDVPLPRGDGAGDLGQEARSVAADIDRDLDGTLRRLPVVPLDGDQPLPVQHVLGHGQAVARMDREAATAGDEAHDAVAGYRRAALAEPDEEIVDPAD